MYGKKAHVILTFPMVQEWPEENYPPYANGPGYIISSDIANFIVSDFEKCKLRVNATDFHNTFTYACITYQSKVVTVFASNTD